MVNATNGKMTAALTLGGRTIEVPIHRTVPTVSEIPEFEQITIPKATFNMKAGLEALKLAAQQMTEQETAREQQILQKKEAKRKQKEQICALVEWVNDCPLQGLYDIGAILKDMKTGDQRKTFLQLSSPYEEVLTIAQQLKKWQDEVDQHKNNKNQLISLSVIVGEAKFWLSKQEGGVEGFMSLVEKLTKEGTLREDRNGPIATFNQKRFSLGKKFDVLETEDRNELFYNLKIAIDNQVTRIKKELEEEGKVAIAGFMEKATIKPVDLFRGTIREGYCCLPTFRGGPDGDKLEGALLTQISQVETQDESGNTFLSDKIVVIDALGRHKNGFQALRDTAIKFNEEIFLYRQELIGSDGQLLEKPPQFWIPAQITRQEEKKAWNDSNLFLWYAIRNGILTALSSEDRKLSYVEFFEERFCGCYKISLPSWKWTFGKGKPNAREEKIENLELTIERFKNNKKEIRLKVKKYSPKHQDFLKRAGCLTVEGYLDADEDSLGFSFFTALFNAVMGGQQQNKFIPFKK